MPISVSTYDIGLKLCKSSQICIGKQLKGFYFVIEILKVRKALVKTYFFVNQSR